MDPTGSHGYNYCAQGQIERLPLDFYANANADSDGAGAPKPDL